MVVQMKNVYILIVSLVLGFAVGQVRSMPIESNCPDSLTIVLIEHIRNRGIPLDLMTGFSSTRNIAKLVLPHRVSNSSIRTSKARGPGVFNPIKDTKIVLFFDPQNLGRIKRQGFLNRHQTGWGSGEAVIVERAQKEDLWMGGFIEPGGYDAWVRKNFEPFLTTYNLTPMKRRKILQDLRLRSPYNEFRPKSAYMIFKDPTLDIGDTVFRTHYGRVGAIFKEHVKAQSTWAPTDALLAGPSDVFLFENRNVQRSAYQYPSGTRYYFEAQIWGELNIADVEAWTVPKGFSTRSETGKFLKATGIPVLEYEVIHVAGKNNAKPSQRVKIDFEE